MRSLYIEVEAATLFFFWDLEFFESDQSHSHFSGLKNTLISSLGLVLQVLSHAIRAWGLLVAARFINSQGQLFNALNRENSPWCRSSMVMPRWKGTTVHPQTKISKPKSTLLQGGQAARWNRSRETTRRGLNLRLKIMNWWSTKMTQKMWRTILHYLLRKHKDASFPKICISPELQDSCSSIKCAMGIRRQLKRIISLI